VEAGSSQNASCYDHECPNMLRRRMGVVGCYSIPVMLLLGFTLNVWFPTFEQAEYRSLRYLVPTNFFDKHKHHMFRFSQHSVFRAGAPSQGVFSRIQNYQVRTVRTRGGTNIYTDALRRDERLLKVSGLTFFAVDELIR
jgi:hypothetical protein